MSLEIAKRWAEAILRRDYDTAEALFHPDVVSETPRGRFHGVGASRQALENATGGYDHIALEHSEPHLEEIEGDVVVRTHDVGRWRDSGDIAFERDLAVRLTIEGGRITRVIVTPSAHTSG